MQVTARLVRLAAGAVVNNQAGSVHTIARVVDVDPATAAVLMDELEQAGIVGPAKVPAGRLRDVLLRPDELTRARLDALTIAAGGAVVRYRSDASGFVAPHAGRVTGHADSATEAVAVVQACPNGDQMEVEA